MNEAAPLSNLLALTASIGDGVITTDVHGRVSFMNPTAETMTGWQLATARAQPLERVFTIVNEFTREPVVNPVQQVLREGTIIALGNHTLLLARDGSEIAIEDSAAPIRDAHDSICGTVMVFHDVSGRRRAEAALRDADRRKDEFLATLAHELRNPLAPIWQAALISKAPGATGACGNFGRGTKAASPCRSETWRRTRPWRT